MGYDRDREWSDGLIVSVKRILGETLIGEAPEEVDREEATDLMVFSLRPFTVGVRMRRPEYFANALYRGEFTIRSRRPSGVDTEFKKIMDGWGDYFFYGFAAGGGQSVRAYTIIDLNRFRSWLLRQGYRNNRPWREKRNHDRSSAFAIFKVSDLPPSAIVRRDGFADGRAAA